MTINKQFAQRLITERKRSGFSQEELARRCGWSEAQTRISQYETGKRVPRDDDLRKLAIALSSSPEFLRYGITSTASTTRGRVPLMSKSTKGSGLIETAEWIDATVVVSDEAFGMVVEGDSMTHPTEPKSIPDGSVVIVDPGVSPKNGSVVVASVKGEIIVKKLIIDGPNKYLKSANPDYKPIPVDKTTEILGVVRQMYVTF